MSNERLQEWRKRWNNGDVKFVRELFEEVERLQAESKKKDNHINYWRKCSDIHETRHQKTLKKFKELQSENGDIQKNYKDLNKILNKTEKKAERLEKVMKDIAINGEGISGRTCSIIAKLALETGGRNERTSRTNSGRAAR